MIEGHDDLDAAEQALRSAYKQIVERCNGLTPRLSKRTHIPTIVHIMPKGRRVESGWYKMAQWSDKSEAIVEDLDLGMTGNPARDEVFVAGEALSGTPREVVDLLFHQYIHQFAGIESNSTYHGAEYMQTAHSLGVGSIKRHLTQGWVEFDYGTQLDKVLDDVAASLDRKAFDLYRHPEITRVGSGKMRLWKCKCVRGPSVYTGRILHAVCDVCNERFLYAHKDQEQDDVRTRIHNGGEHTFACMGLTVQ